MASLRLEDGALVYKSPFNRLLVAQLKSGIPATDRTWDHKRKVWIVTPQWGQYLVDITWSAIGERITAPQVKFQKFIETRILTIFYIGATKDRGGGEESAFGMLPDKSWGVIFPRTVLEQWFSPDDELGISSKLPDNLYARLGITRAVGDSEIKDSFKRMARQWHPDVCKEPDAAEKFIQIKAAYDILSKPNSRARYDAGLVLEASMFQKLKRADINKFSSSGYRAPLRCGFIMAEGYQQIGRFVVEKIMAWQDVKDDRGHTLVASWPADADEPMLIFI